MYSYIKSWLESRYIFNFELQEFEELQITKKNIILLVISFTHSLVSIPSEHMDDVGWSICDADMLQIYIHLYSPMNGIERMQCNIQSDAITLTTLKYSATIIVHIYRY